ncbi:MAG: amidohydrolase family protein [Chloroflexi bacterium]|nr:amidohydrolase family protein [Chloroflexota bacterium]MCI0825693.1 amidohydrolase family protein [Chloroflexota bacterium]
MTTTPEIYDLALTGGTLLDPAQGIHDRRDIAFKDGLVALVAQHIDPTSASMSVDVSGKLITPGLIDLHGHFYHGGNGSAVHADEKCLSAGTTTGVDAGSAGFLNYGAMRDYVFPAHRTRLLAFLHIGAVGLAANRVLGGALHDMRVIDVDQTADAIKDNPGFCFGVKVRMHYNAVARWNAPEAMKQARAAADQSGSRLMVHVSGTPIPLPQVLEYLGPGDIVTHAFNGDHESILDRNGKVRPEVRAAAERGVIMDLAHAGVHCDFEVAKAALQQELPPDTISTDLHVPPPGRTVYLMNDLISQFHAMGLPLKDAVAASTSRPAEVLGLQDSLGSLAPGMSGDAAVYDLREGRFVWHDSAANKVEGKVRLDTFLTVRAGEVAWKEGRLTQMGQC